jgi:hypothetical protein
MDQVLALFHEDLTANYIKINIFSILAKIMLLAISFHLELQATEIFSEVLLTHVFQERAVSMQPFQQKYIQLTKYQYFLHN